MIRKYDNKLHQNILQHHFKTARIQSLHIARQTYQCICPDADLGNSFPSYWDNKVISTPRINIVDNANPIYITFTFRYYNTYQGAEICNHYKEMLNPWRIGQPVGWLILINVPMYKDISRILNKISMLLWHISFWDCCNIIVY